MDRELFYTTPVDEDEVVLSDVIDMDVIRDGSEEIDPEQGPSQKELEVLVAEDDDDNADDYGLLSAQEERDLARKIKQGDMQARERFILANLGLVNKLARQRARLGMDFEDLAQEGRIGLMRAVERFDPDKGFRFSTYAVWWIRHAIAQFVLDHSSTIRMSADATKEAWRLMTLAKKLETEHGRIFTEEEVIDEYAKSEGRNVDKDHLRFLFLMSRGTRSLNKPIINGNGEEGAELMDVIIDSSSPQIEDEVAERVMVAAVNRVLGGALSERDLNIIKHRFGLDGRKPKSLVEIGRIEGMSYQAISQRLGRIERRLMENGRFKALRNYLDD
jgi:RNA polymerase primary sigma factor